MSEIGSIKALKSLSNDNPAPQKIETPPKQKMHHVFKRSIIIEEPEHIHHQLVKRTKSYQCFILNNCRPAERNFRKFMTALRDCKTTHHLDLDFSE